MNYLAPSLLAADFTRLGEQMRIIDQAGAQYFHYDVMDGQFVPNISMGLPVLQCIRKVTKKNLDVHLMIEHPERYISDFSDAGADIITVHAEACTHLDQIVGDIKREGLMAGVALNPSTPLSVLDYILPEVDMVLVMTVNPGYGGQKMIPYTLDKIRELRGIVQRRGLSTDIEVDGGVKIDNVDQFLAAGANVIVAGSGIFKGDLADNVEAFLKKMQPFGQ
ncbi:MAG: ribulose-phosphate 3-epimerase [Lachnospiraceae bacterium]|nr:ribulose-phosphate 3-epimerase [bacterium]MDY5517439.1 ribulose-phosphate 3-epimerase [Lachnospiraceae bacterium]